MRNPGLNYWYNSARDLFGKVYRDKDKLQEYLSRFCHFPGGQSLETL